MCGLWAQARACKVAMASFVPHIASGLPFLSISPHVVLAEVLVLERKGPNTRQVPMQLYGYVSAKIKRIIIVS